MNNIPEQEKVNYYMSRACELARQGRGRTLPNPIVGAVIVKDGRIIGEGFHRCFGGLHAERNALAEVMAKDAESAAGADMYVSLEPCAHHGKTPPCTEAIIESGIKRVFIGSSDPNPKVSGKGVSCLKDAGIEVAEGVLKKECDEMNRIFFHYISTGLPYVMLKYAMSADGKIATRSGDSKWISSQKSRDIVQEMRNEYPAIMAGLGTVITDNPKLTCRAEGGTNPIRLICDSRLRIPAESFIVQSAHDIPSFVICAIPGLNNGVYAKAHLNGELKDEYIKRYSALVSDAAYDISRAAVGDDELFERLKTLTAYGMGIINVCDKKCFTDLKELIKILGDCGIAGLLLEGGSELNFSALEAGIVNEVNVFVGAKLIGGPAKTPLGGAGVESISQAFGLRLAGCEIIEDDVLIKYMT